VSAGSFLDGGGSRPLQRKAVELLAPAAAMAETKAIQDTFGKKRSRLLNGLRDLGFTVELPPEGTFYVWASAEHLPPSIRDATTFFRAALERKVITVPGDFFDVDPGKRRGGRPSRFRRHLRFSFGPPMASLELALDRLKELITSAT
jgi:aspartate/methionine/tyrosine aminotransferase